VRKAGRLVGFEDGTINAAASDVRRAEMTDPDPYAVTVVAFKAKSVISSSRPMRS
jgi:hypothetical protein